VPLRAIVLKAFGSVDHFAGVDLPIPEVRQGEVRVRVRAASFNPVDSQIRKGLPEGRLVRSMILGRDLSGSVDAVAEDVPDFKVGDEVFGYVCNLASSGTYAEYVCVPAALMARKPACLTHEQAAAVPVAGITASIALGKVEAGRTRTLFIAGGAGGVGTFATLLARCLGVENLVTTAGNATSRAHLIEQCGLRGDQIIDYKAPGFIERALQRHREGFDGALDLVGGTMLSRCCALLAVDGHLASATEAPGVDDFEVLFQKNASFHSVGANAYSLTENRATWRKYRDMLDALSRQFVAGALPPPPTRVLGEMSPEVVAHAHTLLEGHGVQGKLVMTVGAEAARAPAPTPAD